MMDQVWIGIVLVCSVMAGPFVLRQDLQHARRSSQLDSTRMFDVFDPVPMNLISSGGKFGGQCLVTEKRSLLPKPCKFPFKYQGRIFNGCIRLNDPAMRLWCSTEIDERGFHILGREVWGHCDETGLPCPVDAVGKSLVPVETIHIDGNPVILTSKVEFVWLRTRSGSDSLYSVNCEFGGNEVDNLKTVDVFACIQACELRNDCSLFTWSPAFRGTCSLISESGRGSPPVHSPNKKCGQIPDSVRSAF